MDSSLLSDEKSNRKQGVPSPGRASTNILAYKGGEKPTIRVNTEDGKFNGRNFTGNTILVTSQEHMNFFAICYVYECNEEERKDNGRCQKMKYKVMDMVLPLTVIISQV